MTFPICGHFYLECDRNFIFIKSGAYCKLPESWCQEVENVRSSPSFYVVIRVNRTMVKGWTDRPNEKFVKNLAFARRPVKELHFTKADTNLASYRTTYNAAWLKDSLKKPRRGQNSIASAHRKLLMKVNFTYSL